MPTSEGGNPGKARERRCVLKEHRKRIDRTCGRYLPIGDVPSEHVDLSGVAPKVALGLVCAVPLGRVSRTG
jgi:hypothetical protein